MDNLERHDRASPARNSNPGSAYKRNFTHNPRGKLHIRMARGKKSRSKSSRG